MNINLSPCLHNYKNQCFSQNKNIFLQYYSNVVPGSLKETGSIQENKKASYCQASRLNVHNTDPGKDEITSDKLSSTYDQLELWKLQITLQKNLNNIDLTTDTS